MSCDALLVPCPPPQALRGGTQLVPRPSLRTLWGVRCLHSLPDDVLDAIGTFCVRHRRRGGEYGDLVTLLNVFDDRPRDAAAEGNPSPGSLTRKMSDSLLKKAATDVATNAAAACVYDAVCFGAPRLSPDRASFAWFQACHRHYASLRRLLDLSLIGREFSVKSRLLRPLLVELPRTDIRVCATQDVRGGATKHQFAENLISDAGIEEEWSKWRSEGGFPLKLVFALPPQQEKRRFNVRVDGYAVKTANDAQRCDPISWDVDAVVDSANHRVIHVVRKCDKMKAAPRFTWIRYELSEPVVGPFRAIQIKIREANGAKRSCHLSQVCLFGEILPL